MRHEDPVLGAGVRGAEKLGAAEPSAFEGLVDLAVAAFGKRPGQKGPAPRPKALCEGKDL